MQLHRLYRLPLLTKLDFSDLNRYQLLRGKADKLFRETHFVVGEPHDIAFDFLADLEIFDGFVEVCFLVFSELVNFCFPDFL